MKTIDVHEWFERMERSSDQETMRAFLSSLDGYKGTAPLNDMLQCINFLTAVRLQQLKNTRMPGDMMTREEIVNSNSLEAQMAARKLMEPK